MANIDGWQKVWTSEGKPYYQNKSTNQTQWDPPKGFIDDNSVQKQFQQYSSMSEDQWMEVFDNKGRSYWENKITGETSYDRPDSAPASPRNDALITENQSPRKQYGDSQNDPDEEEPIFYGNNNQPINAKSKQVIDTQHRTTTKQQNTTHPQAWDHSPLEREPLNRSQKTYFYCHIITDILCVIAAVLCLKLPDKWAEAGVNDCADTVDSISSVGQAVLILTILSMCICSVPYLCMMVYGKITDKSVQSVIVCFMFMVGGIGILWTIGIIVLLWQISKGLTTSECLSVDGINGDLVTSMILLIPSILRAVYICCMILNEHRGSV